MLRAFYERVGVNRRVFAAVVVSALLIVAARTIAPFEVGKDQASQLEAAQRLSRGLGLTTTNDVPPSAGFDITEAPRSRYLTWWPPGLSILVAGFLFLGLPLLVSLKLIYAAVTLAGWCGWGVAAGHLLAQPLKVGSREYPVNLLIAALMPVFCTPSWDGTDIFLWAGVPFVALLLFTSAFRPSPWRSVALAGLLFGCLYAIRYASVFVAPAAILILLQVSLPDAKAFLKRSAVFLVFSLLVILPVVAYTRTYAQSAFGGHHLDNPIQNAYYFSKHAYVVINLLPVTSNAIVGHPVVEQVVRHTLHVPWLIYATGAVCLLIILSLPIFLARSSPPDARPPRADFALSLSFLPLSLVAIFVVIVYGNMLGVRRYYEPVALCGLFIFYAIAAARPARRWVKAGATMIVASFVLYVCAYMPALAFVPGRRSHLVSTVLSYMPPNSRRYPSTSHDVSYPGYQMFSCKESSRQRIRRLHDAHPGALFFVEEYGYFNYDEFQGDGPVRGDDLRVFPHKIFWKLAYTSKPVKIFWIVNRETELDFIPPAYAQAVSSDEVEDTKIIMSDLPAGYKFSGQLASSGAQ
ncbi:MAG: hypothetical protein ACRD68_06875 [Pyrinomonadaceae bacterium]